ncbi:MAG TPA: glycosyltransferase family 4 protein [Candidatus Acidoferrum sp.]|nr:glycosyltransferase family 4 protein [Candidatus Acidoferrum sp.]
MRLAIVTPFLDRRHGTERAFAELVERLARDYHCEIHLFSQRVEDLPVTPWSRHRSAESGVIFWHRVPSAEGPLLFSFVFWYLLNRLCRWSFTFWHGAEFTLVLSPGVNCSDANVVIVHAIFHRLRELSQDHSEPTLQALCLFRRIHRQTYYALLTGLERRIYSNQRVTLAAVSKRTAAQLASYFHRTDVRVVSNGVDTVLFSPLERLARREQARDRRGFRTGDFVLLLIGNDWEVKGLATILRAMALLGDAPLRLIVVGSDSPQAFQQLAQGLGVFGRCQWEQPSSDVLDFYAAADVYVSPTREDSFGMPVAEAMACGLPVITSSDAGVSELLHDGIDGFVLRDPLDVSTLAKLLRLLHGQPELRERIGHSATQSALAWTWDRNAAAVWKLLNNRKG